MDAVSFVRVCNVALQCVVARRRQEDAVVVVRVCGDILYPRIVRVCKQYSIGIFCQYQISHRYIRGTHNPYKACIVWNLLILLTDPVVYRFSIYCVTRVYGLCVFAPNTEVVCISGHLVVEQIIVARMRQEDAVPVVRVYDVVRKRVVARM